MCYMEAHVGVRELRQNLSVYLERIALGETLQVTDRGRAVAILAPLPKTVSVLERLRLEGHATAAAGDLLTIMRPLTGRTSRRGSRALRRVRADRKL
jgi:antitoxin (DNA-binding transcriptional repressor) of toxin-antitoxin stability system